MSSSVHINGIFKNASFTCSEGAHTITFEPADAAPGAAVRATRQRAGPVQQARPAE